MAFARSAKVVIDRAALGRLTGPGGPVDADARRKAVKTAEIARTLVTSKSGRLRSSIRVTRSRAPAWNVEAGRSPRCSYALIHHNGRKALPRKSPSDPKPLYVFEIDGETIFTPGPIKAAKGTFYLTRAAKRAGLRVSVRGGR